MSVWIIGKERIIAKGLGNKAREGERSVEYVGGCGICGKEKWECTKQEA